MAAKLHPPSRGEHLTAAPIELTTETTSQTGFAVLHRQWGDVAVGRCGSGAAGIATPQSQCPGHLPWSVSDLEGGDGRTPV